MKTVEVHYMPDDTVWVAGEHRECIIDQVIISKVGNRTEITYTWANYDYGVDITELWNEGEFSSEDIGKTVFDSLEEYEKAFPEEFNYPKYEGEVLSFD